MIQSMTGFGKASATLSIGSVDISIQAVNSRFFNAKCSISDIFRPYQFEIEKRIKNFLTRGSVNFFAKFKPTEQHPRIKLNPDVAMWYKLEILKMAEIISPDDEEFYISQNVPQNNLVIDNSISIGEFLDLPGVIVEEDEMHDISKQDLEELYKALDSALEELKEMRISEGKAMLEEFTGRTATMSELVDKIEVLKDTTIKQYHKNLQTKTNELINGSGIQVNSEDLAREVAFFAERSDISEEISRLRHHIGHFQDSLANGGETGRKLDFIAQEMLRETNTIASKSNNSEISEYVVELKAEIEKIKEQVQNVL